MAVALEFIDFIIPRRVIEEKYKGGWPQFLEDFDNCIGSSAWYDEHLFRYGTMCPQHADDFLKTCEGWGFEVSAEENGNPVCKDVCVVEIMWGGPKMSCDWLEIDYKAQTAYLAGTEPGPVSYQDKVYGRSFLERLAIRLDAIRAKWRSR